MDYTSKGQGALNTVLGAIGTAGVVGGSGILGNLFGGWNNMDPSTRPITRYEMELNQSNAAKDSEIALLKADKYTDQKFADFNDRYNERFRAIESELARQAVHNQRTEDSFAIAQADLRAVKSELKHDIELEAERRCCSDNALADYVNATFYPKLVADVTAGTTTTAQTLFNPVRNCGGCCK